MKLLIKDYFSSSSDNFSVYYSDPEGNNKEHCHEFDELVVVRQGHGLHVINDEPHFIKSGDVYFVKKGDRHFYDELGSLKLINILIQSCGSFVYLKNVDELLQQLDASNFERYGWLDSYSLEKNSKIIKGIFSKEEMDSDTYLNVALQESLFFQLIANIIGCEGGDKNSTEYKVNRMLKHIRSNCFSNLDWEELSGIFHLSYRTMFRSFKSITGLTPENYVKRLRLIYARRMIRDSEDSITNIAYECGFSNSNHFTKAYKDLFLSTPRDDRVNLRE